MRIAPRLRRRGKEGTPFAAEALAAGISVFELSRLMVVSIAMMDLTYGRLARDSEAAISCS